ncbi:protein-tyrosine phosphatase family protein [Edaphobacter aggregans]|uniref:protein-tyrosine phosphatase family protein n=1 Tax=Edaphobacter aggregans TaxID=570835 RepID=UPI00055821FA|nr:dual specificity protein phosphatase family protein [Edaphobacter aggregans]
MNVRPYWITPQLAIVPRPRGGNWLNDEMRALREAGIDSVVSMLEPHEAAELGLEHEQSAAERAGISLISFPIPDRTIPKDLEKFAAFVSELEQRISAGERIGVHCRACIGRSGVVTASLLIRSGIPPADAWSQISIARGYPVPDTAEQEAWVNQNIKARG